MILVRGSKKCYNEWKPMLHPAFSDQLVQMILAAILSGAIGIERLITDKPAGLRTCILIGTSSCLFTMLSMHGFERAAAFDPSRVAAQIVVGVGFLGGGSLIHAKHHVVGLTTAASIWTVSAIGMAVGVGMYAVAIAFTLLAVATLWTLAPVSNWLEKNYHLGKRRR